MVLSKEEKTSVIKSFGTSELDTGSPEVQVAVLTERIKYMTDHLRANRKDKHNHRGLQRMVSRRTRLLKYLKNTDFTRYSTLIKRLGLRR